MKISVSPLEENEGPKLTFVNNFNTVQCEGFGTRHREILAFKKFYAINKTVPNSPQ